MEWSGESGPGCCKKRTRGGDEEEDGKNETDEHEVNWERSKRMTT